MNLARPMFIAAMMITAPLAGLSLAHADSATLATTSLAGSWHMEGVAATPDGSYVISPAGTQLRITLPADLKLPQGRDILLSKVSDNHYRSSTDTDPVVELTAEASNKAELSIKGRTAYLVVPLSR
ncbi:MULTISPECIES: hypothetical protein [Dyella]|uniref:Lipocalin-like domain-containing protein n=2 Tax=Dyella TaxID=231454 RepID=A0A4V2NMF8_9GAMM|nr:MULTISPECIES: hypothetical protein [Dyella]TBR39247.1 hypothetical protein EYV96_03165 [Dyella terrae]TCI13167.1 hypothetical protein EZM97_07700 [Dyella soli]